MSTPRTIAFHTLGCKLNFSETSSLSKLCRQAGYDEVPFEKPSDIYVINTCSVTDEADKKCRKAVRAAIRQNAQAQVVVVGCYAQLKPEEIAAIPGVSLVLGASEKFKLLDHIHQQQPDSPHALVYSSPIEEVNQFVPSYSIDDRTRSFLKVQDGCDYKCSFCTIPMARGRSRSARIPELLQLAEELIDKGVREIVLTGVNIGDFGNGTEVLEGTKVKKEAMLIDLIQALDELPGDCRFRISSIEPNLCNHDIIEFVAQSRNFMPHFHMPLQSGDDEILAAMRRRYKRALYRDRVEAIKARIPDACIGVDVITGFPGESQVHFQNTYDFIHGLDISYLHVFSYSERSQTPAAEFAASVSPAERHRRSQMLRQLSEMKKRAFYKTFEGSVQEVLVEQKIEGGYLSGFTKNYLRVRVPADAAKTNTLVQVKLMPLQAELIFDGVDSVLN
ncbi:MAG TPA: tRNA (N(6)-L-threonylcarbamoyladenosine(37)-C(2))-methylthiotransferase MtaB [Saprospiraceae bacterium]|nr:tRNA (N(6)-L-threonylcarbamoyladenosine(37)-C(2))-methylthiotransferase MtaB [Saprospiraceae bacterium]